MEIPQPILTASIGLIGVLLGLFINEFFRRKNRIELYSKEVFQKRLSVYEQLYEKMEHAFSVAVDIIENPQYSESERHSLWSAVVLDAAKFTDMNGLYLNQNVVVHCMMTLIGVSDIYEREAGQERDQLYVRFKRSYGESKRMVKKESGLEALDKLFGSVSKAKYKSGYIEYFQNRKKELGIKD